MSAGEFFEWAFVVLVVSMLGLMILIPLVAMIGLGVSTFVDWLREQRSRNG